jgi:small-conductance mechanosensitive channel
VGEGKLMLERLVLNLSQLPVDTDVLEDLITDVSRANLIKALIFLGIAYCGLIVTRKTITWLSEHIPRRFRIGVKQSIPIWQALILLVTILAVLNLFIEVSPSNVVALSGLAVVGLGFAFKDYASSVIAGVVALFEAPYRVGDRVQIGDYYGEVINYGLRGIRLETSDDEMITIPHNKIWTDAIVNVNNGQLEAQVETDFYLSHHANPQQVIELLSQAAYTSKYCQVKLPVNVVLEETIWGTRFQLQSYVMDAREEEEYQTDLIKRTKAIFTNLGITYPVVANSALQSPQSSR